MNAKTPAKETLGKYLSSIREAKGMSLREVEQASQNEVSNAYLSQLETGKVERPSPRILLTLAEVLGLSYEYLMQLAGYIPAPTGNGKKRGHVATFAIDDLTTDEEAELLKYLAFLRSRRNRDEKRG